MWGAQRYCNRLIWQAERQRNCRRLAQPVLQLVGPVSMVGVGQRELRRSFAIVRKTGCEIFTFRPRKFLERQGSCESADTRERANKTA